MDWLRRSEAAGAPVSTLNGPAERHSSLKVHSAPSLASRVKASGTAAAVWFVPSEHTTLAPRAASACEIVSAELASMSEELAVATRLSRSSA